jgi:outer membrane protein TolC
VPSTLILAWLLTAGPTCGPVDLDTALALATERSDEVGIKRAELATAEADMALARAARWIPIASATVLTGAVPEARGTVLAPAPNQSNRSFEGWGPFGRIDVSVIQPLFTWGRLDAAQEAARAGIEARSLLLRDTSSQIHLRVVQLFWGTALARKLLAIAADVEKSLADVDQRITKSLAEGSTTVAPSDRYKLDLYKSLLRRRKADAVKGRDLAQSAIAATLAVSPERLQLQEAPLPAPPTDVPDLLSSLQEAVHRRPDLAALDQAITARTAELKAMRAAQLPQLFIGGTFAYSFAPNRDIQTNPWVSDWFNTLAFGASIGIRQDLAFPLMHAQSEKARAERATLETQKVALARLVEVQVESAIADLKAIAERYEASKSSLQTAKSWFRSAGLDFEAGVAEAKDVLEAYGAYVENQVENATATYELVMARARLDQITGAAPVRRQPSCELN